jgi:hypothetical protein
MDGILALVVVALLGAFAIRWAAAKTRLPVPARGAVMVVFVLVVLALWGQSLR